MLVVTASDDFGMESEWDNDPLLEKQWDILRFQWDILRFQWVIHKIFMRLIQM